MKLNDLVAMSLKDESKPKKKKSSIKNINNQESEQDHDKFLYEERKRLRGLTDVETHGQYIKAIPALSFKEDLNFTLKKEKETTFKSKNPWASESLLEYLFIKEDIRYMREVHVKAGGKRFFDYYLPDFNTFIEFDGPLHFLKYENYKNDDFEVEEKYKPANISDDFKEKFCLHYGFNLLRLTYNMSSEDIVKETLFFLENTSAKHQLLKLLKTNESDVYDIYVLKDFLASNITKYYTDTLSIKSDVLNESDNLIWQNMALNNEQKKYINDFFNFKLDHKILFLDNLPENGLYGLFLDWGRKNKLNFCISKKQFLKEADAFLERFGYVRKYNSVNFNNVKLNENPFFEIYKVSTDCRPQSLTSLEVKKNFNFDIFTYGVDDISFTNMKLSEKKYYDFCYVRKNFIETTFLSLEDYNKFKSKDEDFRNIMKEFF